MPKQMRKQPGTSHLQLPACKDLREKRQLNGKEGIASTKGAWTPLAMTNAANSPQMEAPKA